MKSNILTTVTSEDTIHEETYSEYVSNLRESETTAVSEKNDTNGIYADTKMSAISTERQEAVTAVTKVSSVESEEQQEETVTCSAEFEETTVPPFDLDKIPSVPSSNVKENAALSVN